MSTLLVEVCKIDSVVPHTNADNLEIAHIKGWQVIVRKGSYTPGDLVIYVPPDAMVPRELSQKWGVEKYLSFRKENLGRVKAAKLRGVASFGFTTSIEEGMVEGQDVAEHFGITKYEPPARDPRNKQQGEPRWQHPLFHKYTDMENLRNFKDKLDYNTDLVVTEKIHGTNSRIGYVYDKEQGRSVWMVGSHNVQRHLHNCGIYGLPFTKYKESLDALARFIDEQNIFEQEEDRISVIIYGEIYGPEVQDLTYGVTDPDWRIFDISVNGEYRPFIDVLKICEMFNLPCIPVLDHSEFVDENGYLTFESLTRMAEGNSVFADHIREGVVVKPKYSEKTWINSRNGDSRRMIFKLISPDYLSRKNGTEYH